VIFLALFNLRQIDLRVILEYDFVFHNAKLDRLDGRRAEIDTQKSRLIESEHGLFYVIATIPYFRSAREKSSPYKNAQGRCILRPDTKIMRTSFFVFLSLLTLFSATLFIVPITPAEAAIIPCGTKASPAPCTLCHLIVGINQIIVLLRNIMTAIAIVVIVAMAIVYITSAGNEARMSFAKSGISAALVGFCIILLAWLIVNFVLTLPIFSGGGSGLIRTGWDSLTCNTTSRAIGG
jgi:hypothetical protein